ncbi:LysR family transcriptional regulator [Fusibacter sp. JL216-2]|uniref:LysR family transcriptional regulator n=1 Tax=Fusibacter sp. JL216-2 TaxID=3071453 RepID=UPI003D33C65C
MDIRHFITFKKVAELGNFTRASEILGYSQSSVTSHIKALESDMGVLLFDRIGKTIELTQKGIQLLEYVNELLDAYTKIESIGQEDETPKGIIRIGVPETLMLYRLDMVFKTYKAKYPNVTIVLENTPSSRLVDALHKGELDLAFILDHEVKDPDLTVTTLINEPMCYIFPSNYTNISLDSIPDELSIFLTEKGCSYRYIFEHDLKSSGVPSNNVMETWSVETIKKCVINGIGMSFLPHIVVAEEERDGRLIVLPSIKAHGTMLSQIAHHKKKWLSPALKAFLELTLESAKTWDN